MPATLSSRDPATTSTQAAFGRTLLDLSRVEGVAERLVTVAPDVSSSTNLGGFINKTGVWGPDDEPVYDAMEDSPLKWRVGPAGQHIEMGIAEMNLVLLLGQLGLTWDYQRERLFPIGTLYDPFVMRALEGIVYSTYSGSRFVLAGTPSGISLSREGGAHQSLSTPGIGIETPGLTYAEPCYARELEWLLLDALARMQTPEGEALYLRLSTTPIDQAPFSAAVERLGEERLRADVVAGGFRLREPGASDDRVLLAACGAIVPQALEAATLLSTEEGVEATVLCLSSPDRLYHDWQTRRTAPLHGHPVVASHLERLVAARRARPSGRHRDRRRQPRALVRRQRPRRPLGHARRRPLRPDRQPARGLRRIRNRRSLDRDRGARRARASYRLSRKRHRMSGNRSRTERTVSVPACLRGLQFVTVCCCDESCHFQADSVSCSVLRPKSWTIPSSLVRSQHGPSVFMRVCGAGAPHCRRGGNRRGNKPLGGTLR